MHGVPSKGKSPRKKSNAARPKSTFVDGYLDLEDPYQKVSFTVLIVVYNKYSSSSKYKMKSLQIGIIAQSSFKIFMLKPKFL